MTSVPTITIANSLSVFRKLFILLPRGVYNLDKGTWNNICMYRNPQLPSLARRLCISLSIGLVFATIGAAVEAVIGAHSWVSFDSFDDLLIGFLTAGVIFGYEQRRYRTTMEKIQMISAMNHHVRNALQAISYSPYAEHEKQMKLIAESVSRIEWALREILPGEIPPGDSSQSEPGHRPATASPRLD
jgi:hypothetical protein